MIFFHQIDIINCTLPGTLTFPDFVLFFWAFELLGFELSLGLGLFSRGFPRVSRGFPWLGFYFREVSAVSRGFPWLGLYFLVFPRFS